MNDLVPIGPLADPKPPRPKNLKVGDRVKFVGAGPDCTEGVISDINGELVMIVIDKPNGDRFEVERYRGEITERLAEFQPVPITGMRLRYLIEMAEPESEERQQRRVDAQEELMEMLKTGQVMRTSRGHWIIDPEWGLDRFR
jgi:hypothetical protein